MEKELKKMEEFKRSKTWVKKQEQKVLKQMQLDAEKIVYGRGGKRLNAGRKSQYKEETQTISFRVPKSLIEPITKYVKRALEKSKK